MNNLVKNNILIGNAFFTTGLDRRAKIRKFSPQNSIFCSFAGTFHQSFVLDK
jgi:hypothetical protein